MADRGAAGDGPLPPEVLLLQPDEWYLARDTRLAALRDAPDVLLPTQPHEADWTEEQWRESLTDNLWAVAQTGTSVVGLARLTPVDGVSYVESVWTRPGHRRRGIASKLVSRLVDVGLERWPGDVFVWVIHPNPAAVSLYERLGFESTGETQRLDSIGRDEERLRLTTRPPTTS